MIDLTTAVAAVNSVTGGPCFLHKPVLTTADEDAVLSVLSRGDMVRSDIIRAFEAELCDITERRHCVATSSGTMALVASSLCLTTRRMALNVALPTITFAATMSAMPGYVGPSIPRRLYSAQDGGSGDASLAVTVDLFGIPGDVKGHADMVLHDGCESLGSANFGRHVGDHANVSTLSFNANKIVTTGGGGAIVTDDEALAARCRAFINQGRLPGADASSQAAWVPDFVGTNGRMGPVNASLGLSQLKRLPTILAEHRDIYIRYAAALDPIEGVSVILEPADQRWNHWLTVAQVDDPADRDPLVVALNAAGIEARPCFPCLHLTGPWKTEDKFPAAEDFAARTLLLPSGCLGGERVAAPFGNPFGSGF